MLLMGMMAIVAVLGKSGFFPILNVKIAKLTGGSPLGILVLFSLVAAVISAFLDNVATVLIMVPMVIEENDFIIAQSPSLRFAVY